MTIRPILWPKWLSHTPLNKIALSVGYSDPVYFTRLFRKHNGIPPGEYRKRYAEMKG
ncbi:Arabinose operon regulatory protein [Klebsiella pneumoniae]|uniref:Arabinose operon regulatory protein n=1 Tax=Klebsiella pneumoniae TaxID=573 RepID=A0A377WB60_KLEPN|nr:Arabinose operon regulatory protein [Klebsiella pneumoniae]